MPVKVPKIILDDFDDILNFETKESSAKLAPVGISEFDFNSMEDFAGHKFKLYEGQQLDDMAESIRQFGILLPIILWHTDDNRYVVLSGHNRINAGKKAGLTKGPVIIKENLTYEEAVLIVTETNLRQRSFTDLTHSERAFCLVQHYDAIKCQGKRNDLLHEIETLINTHDNKGFEASSEYQTKMRSDEKLGQEYGLSRDKVAKYIRLSTLTSDLLESVDSGEIPFLAAYELSFIEDKDKQQQIVESIESSGYKLDVKKAVLLREYHEGRKLEETAIDQILSGEKKRKPKSDKPKPFKLKPTVISRFFTAEQSQKVIEDTILEALTLYFSHRVVENVSEE